MSKDKYLHQLLNRPQAPQELKDKITANWLNQLHREKSSVGRPGWVAAASLLLIVTLFVRMNNTPDIVYSAINDIASDTKHDVGLSIDLASIQREFNINSLPKSVTLQMSKHCILKGSKTVHLKIADTKNREVHMFLQHGEFETTLWQAMNGKLNTMPWQLLQPRQDLSLLIVYSEDMSTENIDQLTRKMFFI